MLRGASRSKRLKLPDELIKGFLVGKLIEEAIEVRHAETAEDRTGELADLYEVVLALVRSEKVALRDIRQAGK